MLALPHCYFKSFNAFVQARSYFGKPQSNKSLLLPIHGILAVMGNVRHPCRTRVSKVYFTQGVKKLKAKGSRSRLSKLSYRIGNWDSQFQAVYSENNSPGSKLKMVKSHSSRLDMT